MKELNKLISMLFTLARLLCDLKAWFYLFTGKPDRFFRRMKNKYLGRTMGRFYRM